MSLSVKLRGEYVATFRAIEVHLMEMLAAWVPTTPEMEVISCSANTYGIVPSMPTRSESARMNYDCRCNTACRRHRDILRR